MCQMKRKLIASKDYQKKKKYGMMEGNWETEKEKLSLEIEIECLVCVKNK